jgi:transposase
VHKKSIAVCVLVMDEGGKVDKQVRTFKTMTVNLLQLSDWLRECGVTQVAMESTGVLWKPVFNILEGSFKVMLCNAQHIKKVPGRKTDVKDCEWIAQLLQHGLLRGSFVPARPVRELRDLTRHRAQITAEKTREINRIHKVLEDANIKLACVASDVLGKSGRDMLRALIEGDKNPEQMAQLARRRMRGKIPELRVALQGFVREHHRFMLQTHLDHVLYLEGVLERLTQRIEQFITSRALDEIEKEDSAEEDSGEPAPLPFEEALALITEAPGIDVHNGVDILAEITTQMRPFPSEKELSSWGGLCPGNHESAGKRKASHIGKGNRWLKRALTQAAWAASHTKGSYFSAQYHRLAKKRGKKRAIVAVAHSLLTTLYYMLKYHEHFEDLGAHYFDRLNPERVARYHKTRLESLGFTVTLERVHMAA